MKTWYMVTNFGKPRLTEETFVRETEKFLVALNKRRDAKEGKYHRYFDNLADAEAYKAELEEGRAARVADKRIRDAAPELLEALEDAVDSLEYVQNLHTHVMGFGVRSERIARAMAAIAKAKGEA